MTKFLINLVILSFPYSANATDLSESLVEVRVKRPLINERVVIKPTTNHHFNLEAPQDCGNEATMDPSARRIECQFHSDGVKKVTVSVCDDKKKYCKQEHLKFQVRNAKSGTPRIKQDKSAETLKAQKDIKKVLMDGWKSITPEQAVANMNGKKGALVMVSTEWCPPCNVVKEFLLPTTQFKNLTKDLQLIYVDGDSPLKDAWQSRLKTFFYPSFVVLNKNLEVVDLTVGSLYFYKFQNFITKAIKNSADPLTNAKERLEQRIAGTFSRKIMDLFVPQSQIDEDEERVLNSFTARNDNQSYLEFTRKMSAEKYTSEILAIQFNDFWFGKSSKDLTPEEQNKKLLKIARTLLSFYPLMNMESKDRSDFIQHKFCMVPKTKDLDSKKDLTTEECEVVFRRIEDRMAWKAKTVLPKLLEHEKLDFNATQAKEKADLAMIRSKNEQAEEFKKSCRSDLAKLYSFTPLGQKSRAIRIGMIQCLASGDQVQSLNILLSMVNDYPYDSTFYRKLADHYMQKKDFKKALEVNENAVKYAYGDFWGGAIVQRTNILKALKKEKQALSLIEETLGEVVLRKDDNKNWWMNSLRAQQNELEKSLKK